MKSTLSLLLLISFAAVMLFMTGCTELLPSIGDQTTTTEKKNVRTTISEIEWEKNLKKRNFTVDFELSGNELYVAMTNDCMEVQTTSETVFIDRKNKIMIHEGSLGFVGFASLENYEETYVDLGDVLAGIKYDELRYDYNLAAYVFDQFGGGEYVFTFEDGELVSCDMYEQGSKVRAGKIKDIGSTSVELPTDYIIVDDGLPTPSKASADVRTTVTEAEWAINMIDNYSLKLSMGDVDAEIECDGNVYRQWVNKSDETILDYFVRKEGIIYQLTYGDNGFIGKAIEGSYFPSLNEVIASIVEKEELGDFSYNEEGRYYEWNDVYLYFEDSVLKRITVIDGDKELVFYAFDIGSTKLTVPKFEVEKNESQLDFELNCDGTGYTVIGIGTYKDTDVIIPEEYLGLPVVAIAENAFKGNSSITSVTIPNTVETVGEFAFSYCSSIQYNEYDNALYLGNDDNPYMVLIEASNISISDCEIHKDTRIIYESAFAFCRSIEGIVIPDSVVEIGHRAFDNCSSLKNIRLGNSLERIGYEVFRNCDELTYNVKDNVSYLGNESNPYLLLIKANEDLLTCTIPDGTRIIAAEAFYGCNKMSEVAISDTVVFIGNSAFSNCNSLQSVVIPNNVTEIGAAAFNGCSKLGTVTIGSSVAIIGNMAFCYCSSLTEVDIPNSVKIIGEYAFNHCSSLVSLNIGDSVLSVGKEAFSYCGSLETVWIPDSVTSIGYGAFINCRSLVKIIIPSSVVNMGGYVFSNCDMLSIYCRAKTPPEGWSYDWNYREDGKIHTAKWGYKGE